jgi:GTP-binding protein HflX
VHIPQIMVYNKIDRLGTAARIERDAEDRLVAVWISAMARTGLDLLEQAIAERLARTARIARVRLPASAGALRSKLYAREAVREEHASEDGAIELTVELPDVELLVLARTAGVLILEQQGVDIPCTAGEPYLQSGPPASAAKLS